MLLKPMEFWNCIKCTASPGRNSPELSNLKLCQQPERIKYVWSKSGEIETTLYVSSLS